MRRSYVYVLNESKVASQLAQWLEAETLSQKLRRKVLTAASLTKPDAVTSFIRMDLTILVQIHEL